MPGPKDGKPADEAKLKNLFPLPRANHRSRLCLDSLLTSAFKSFWRLDDEHNRKGAGPG
jgi:hypothetical protein